MDRHGPTERLAALLDSGGFLSNPLAWNRALAKAIAHRDGLLALTPRHWVIIHDLREHYRRFGPAPPAFSHICRVHHLGPHCICELFRSEREAWRIAGLPDPGEEAWTYM